MVGRAVVSLLVVAVAQASFAAPCAPVPLSPVTGFQVLPAGGTRVPRSTAIWVRADQLRGGDVSTLSLTDERGKRVGLTSTAVRVTGDDVVTLFVLRPAAILEANTTFRVELNGVVLSKFVTSDEVDTKPPELPVAKVTDVRGGVSCVSSPQVTVQLESPGEINFLIEASNQTPAMPANALAVSSGTNLVASSVSGTVDLRVVAFDLSGNMAMGSENLTTSVPGDGGYGCSSAALPPVAFLALVALRRRRVR